MQPIGPAGPPRPHAADARLRVLHPKSLAEAADILAQLGGGARIVAGGTAFQLEWRRGEPMPAHLVDVTLIPELIGIAAAAQGIRIGAAHATGVA